MLQPAEILDVLTVLRNQNNPSRTPYGYLTGSDTNCAIKNL